ncbi:MAG: hypothetical protein B6D63_03730 [Candidatus Latescibacteria bacterium 4484_7]|nr:MAG: hypothetical protein B6D63_03730 [Candidatus Latescibacteria bacterium 4484_7]
MAISTRSRRTERLPSWLRRRIPRLDECSTVETVVKRNNLHTVCREALCPNRAECYSKGKVTFMILGDVCTRSCRFCAVKKGAPSPPDEGEARRVAEAADTLALKQVIVTSVTRDDLPDGGASVFAAVVRELKKLEPSPIVEVLVPDFMGDTGALQAVLDSGPEIFSHNIETAERLYERLRRNADYHRSLELLRKAKVLDKEVMTKSAMILGMGETYDEIIDVLRDLSAEIEARAYEEAEL